MSPMRSVEGSARKRRSSVFCAVAEVSARKRHLRQDAVVGGVWAAHIVEGLRRAHKSLVEDLRKLDEGIRSPRVKGQGELVVQLADTRAHITEHFRFEEQNGYMDFVRKREPRLERTIQQLCEEHQELAQSLDALIEQARMATGRDDVLREKIQAWIGRLHHHEARENEVVQDAVNRDIGAED